MLDVDHQNGSAATRSPSVAVAIPAYQAEAYLLPTLRSVLHQDYPNLEIVVLDNASSDRTPEILATIDDPRLRVERNPAVLPIAQNWNRLVAVTRSDLVKIVCADDLLYPDAVRRQAELLAADTGLALVSSRVDMIDHRGHRLRTARGLRGLDGRRRADHAVRTVIRSGGNPIGPPATTMFRRADFDKTSGFDASLTFPMDVALWLRLLEHGDFLGMDATTAAFRVAPATLSGRTSVREQWRQQRSLVAQVVERDRWTLGTVDRAVAAVNGIGMQAKRSSLAWTAGRRGIG